MAPSVEICLVLHSVVVLVDVPRFQGPHALFMELLEMVRNVTLHHIFRTCHCDSVEGRSMRYSTSSIGTAQVQLKRRVWSLKLRALAKRLQQEWQYITTNRRADRTGQRKVIKTGIWTMVNHLWTDNDGTMCGCTSFGVRLPYWHQTPREGSTA